MVVTEQEIICPVCGGSGQVSFFKGESRFLLSVEECSECAGTGRSLDVVPGKGKDDMIADAGKRGMTRRKK